ncbi:spindle assembly abnormal protein 6 homolog isoform X2 [Dermacentor silvarum]|nr:spindle assembly abnormal protein 6 homolog isoform X2 [Dermacentor silvarum]
MILDSQYRRADSSGTSELSQEESLYCRTQSVQLKDDFCAGARRVSSLCLAIRRSKSSIIGQKELQIQLTDDADPFFFYTLTLTEEDFQSLKTQQGLLVDFLAFPQKFVDLLELCTKDELKDSPRFVLSLTVHGRIGSDPAILDVIEANPFKHLVHLSLKLAPAPDTVVRKHLTSAMRLLKDENRRLEAAFRSSETDLHSRLQQYQEMATERSRELDRVRSLHASQLASLREQHERELAAEKENVRKATSEQQFRLDLEHRETEQRLKKQIQVLEADVSIKETLNKDLQEKLAKSEQVCRELSLKVTALESAVGQCQRTAEVLSREKDTVEADKQLNEKDASTLRSQLDKLEAELSQKSQLLAETKGLLESCEQKKRQAEALLEQRQAQLSRREAAVKTLSDDILKGNEIIKRLQGELRTYHAKLRLRSEVITKQEDVLTEKEQQVQRLVRRVDDLELASKNKEAEVEKARQRVEEVEQKLAECQKQVKTNENVIQWLNKQLNSCQLQQDKRGSPAGLSSSKQFTSPINQSPTYPTARNFAFPGTGGTAAPSQSTFPNMTPGVRQESPVLLKPIDDSPLVDPRFLQPQAADPTTQRALNPLDTATTPFGTAAIGRQRAPAATQAPPYYPTTAKTKPS